MGRDKARLEIDGQPLWRRQLDTLRELNPEQLMIAGPAFGGAEAVADEWQNAGPLAGIGAALQKCVAPLLVVLAVDLPRMTSAFLAGLLDSSGAGKGVVPRSANFFEPLAAVYPQACAPLADAALRRGDFSMQRFVETALVHELVEIRELQPDEQPLFTNWNSPADR